MRNRHLGRFEIPMQIIEHYPEVAIDILSGGIVVRAELSYSTDAIEYIMIHPCFDEVPKGYPAPRYMLDLLRTERKGEPWEVDTIMLDITFQGFKVDK